jgi:hypothetical protein
MSNSNNKNIYSDSEDEDTNSVEHIYTESNTSATNTSDTNTSANNTPTNTHNIRPGFTFGGKPTAPFTSPFGAAFSSSQAPAQGSLNFGAFSGTPATTFGAVSGVPLPVPESFGAFSGIPSKSASFGGFGLRVDRQPETGQPMGCNLRPPPCMCGGNHNPSEIFNVKSAKQNTIDELYKKLANARAQIQNLNKAIDDIYEIIPKIN